MVFKDRLAGKMSQQRSDHIVLDSTCAHIFEEREMRMIIPQVAGYSAAKPNGPWAKRPLF